MKTPLKKSLNTVKNISTILVVFLSTLNCAGVSQTAPVISTAGEIIDTVLEKAPQFTPFLQIPDIPICRSDQCITLVSGVTTPKSHLPCSSTVICIHEDDMIELIANLFIFCNEANVCDFSDIREVRIE